MSEKEQQPFDHAITEEAVLSALREVYDPEIPVNVVDLGLIYQVKIIEDWVGVKMTLTSPGCGLADQIANQVREKLLDVPGVVNGDVRIVWQPAWSPGMMHPEARKKLVMFPSIGAQGGEQDGSGGSSS